MGSILCWSQLGFSGGCVSLPEGQLLPMKMFSNSHQPQWVTLAQINSDWLKPCTNLSACEPVRKTQRGALQQCRGEGCWTRGVFSRWCSNSVSKQHFAFRLRWQGVCWQVVPCSYTEKIPTFACMGVCTIFSASCVSRVSETGLQLPQAGKAQATR